MNKVFKVLLFLAFLWVLSYALASVIFDQQVIPYGSEVAVIPVMGTITLDGDSGLLSSSSSATDIADKIRTANENAATKAIVLEINSPGGTVMGAKKVVDALKKVDKPVVAVITEYGTSGAYWIASQSDVIVADELSIVGSIGVIGSYLEFSGLLNDFNVSYERLVTGDYKDISSPYKELTDEERELIEERLQKIHDYFVADVASGRDMSIADTEKLATGIFYLGMDGVDNGLIDEIGDKDYAILRAKQLANITNGQVAEYKEEEGWLQTALRDYTAYSSFYIGQGVGSMLLSTEAQNLQIRAE